MQLIFGIVEVIAFFYYSNLITMRWANLSEKSFVRNLFQLSLVIRVLWVFLSYFIYLQYTGTPFDFSAADALGYDGEAKWVASMITNGDLSSYFRYINGRYSDMGYPFFLGVQYWFTDNSILIARLLKALFGSLTVLYAYKLASRNFGVEVGRMAGILMMLFPNLIFYTGYHLKEVEMIFLTTLFLEKADNILRTNQYSFFKILVLFLIASSLFFFRTVLGASVLFALVTTIIFTTERASKSRQRWFLAIWAFVAVGFFLGSSIASEVEQVWEMRNTNQQQSLQWRSERKGGNAFAKYASATIFAPAILVIPLPTMVKVEGQPNQMMMNGGYYVKNFMSFFVMFALFHMITRKKWRDHLLIISFLLGYLIVIALSSFAQSERFHQPAMPVFLIMAAYGIHYITEKEKNWFNIFQILLFAALVGWSWFKLAGRGLA
jgi:4-amino-4-deoxy-L-arabinose transferase-like glycosyltransferase